MNQIKVVGVSLGSAQRDFEAEVCLGGATFSVKRTGLDGQIEAAVDMIKELDGKVAAIGLGGVNLDYRIAERRYPIREGKEMARAAKATPVVDGAFVKEDWEPALLRSIVDRGELELRGKRVLMTSVLDRYPLAVCLQDMGAEVSAGDALLALKLPLIFPSLRSFSAASYLAMPILSRLPLKYLYPLGKKQEVKRRGWDGLLRGIDMIAGDFHLINRFLPQDLSGKTFITSTLTGQDWAELERRGACRVIPLGIRLGDRALGANLLDAVITAAARRKVLGSSDRGVVARVLLEERLKMI